MIVEITGQDSIEKLNNESVAFLPSYIVNFIGEYLCKEIINKINSMSITIAVECESYIQAYIISQFKVDCIITKVDIDKEFYWYKGSILKNITQLKNLKIKERTV